MIKSWRSITLMVAVLAISGCAGNEGVFGYYGYMGCLNNTKQKTKDVNWAKADVIDITFQNDRYSPFISSMKAGDPYIIRINNKDKNARWFTASDLLRSSAVAQIKNGDKVYTKKPGLLNNCANSINIAANSKAEIRLVAIDKGGYKFEDTAFAMGNLYKDSPAAKKDGEQKTFFFQEDIAVGSGSSEKAFGIITID